MVEVAALQVLESKGALTESMSVFKKQTMDENLVFEVLENNLKLI